MSSELEKLKEKVKRQKDVIDNISDGWHTFGELYDYRMSLQIALLNTNKVISWKSKLHHDGSMLEGGYFICGIATPKGQVTNHYKLEHWDKFKIDAIERAPKWDGHTAKDCLERLESLERI